MQKFPLRLIGWSVLIALLIFLFIPANIKAQFDKSPPFTENPTNPFLEKQERQLPKYAPGEVLVKFKEGVDPEAVLQEIDLETKNVERIHSIKPAVTKFRKNWKLERDSNGWYWFLGKKYQEVEDVPDEEVFQEAYKEMSPEEKALYNSYKITLPEGISVEQAVVELENSPDVEYAQPNYLLKLYMVPTDPYYHSSGSWGQPYDDLWALKRDKLNCERAWDISQGEGVKVAVIDTGVDYNHEDIAKNVWINEIELRGWAGVDDDRNGYVDDIRGWDFSGDEFVYPPIGDNDPSDYYGHGTHCAGIIAAVANNNKGIIGVAPRAEIIVIKIFPNAYFDVAAQAIKYAVDNGAKVLSCSWGPFFRMSSIPLLEDAVSYAYSRNCVVVFAAGNNNDNVAYYSPANHSKTIAVASTDHNDVTTDFSNWGNKIDIAAPGGDSGDMFETSSGEHYYVNILSLRAANTDMYEGAPNYTPGEFIIGDNYYRARGTSIACPHVAGVAALIIGQDSSRTAEDVKQILFASADDKGEEGFDKYYGFGRVNAFRALVVDAISYVCARIRKPEPERQFSKVVTVTGTAIAKNFSHYTIDIGEGEEPTTWTDFGVSLINSGTLEVVDGNLGIWDSSSLSYGTYTIRLSVFDTSGSSREDRVTVVINNLIQEGWPQDVEGAPSSKPIVADIDNDGDLEVIASSSTFNEGNVYVWHHDGTQLEGWPVSICDIPRTPAAGDLDGDGYTEIVVENWDFDRNERLFIFQYDGTLYPGDWPKGDGEEYGWEISQVTTTPIIADLDNDGFLEIIVGGEDGRLHAWHHDGTIVSGWPVNVEYSRFITTPAAGDIDGDGRLEIVAVVAVEEPVHDGEFYSYIYSWNDDGTLISGNWPVKVEGAVEPPVLGDIDGDNQLEIVVNALGCLFAFEHDGTVMPGWPKKLQLEEFNWGPPMLGDLDRDGIPEVIVAAGSFSFDSSDNIISKSGVWVFRGDGTTFGNWPYGFDFHDYGWVGSSVVANVDADDEVEVVVLTNEYDGSYERSYLYIFENNGRLELGYPRQFDVRASSVPALADLDGDSDVELASFGNYSWSLVSPFYVYDLQGYCEDRRLEWPMFHHDPQHTGVYVPPELPIYELSLKDGDIVSGDVYVSMTYGGEPVPWFMFMVDGHYARHNPWRTQYFSNGEHTVYGKYASGGEWHETPPITVIVDNEISYVPEIISPAEGSEVSGNVTVTFETNAPSAYFAFLYANDKIVGWKVLYRKQPPHNILWRTAKLPNGPCDLRVVVYYFLAGVVSSESVRVNINNTTIPPPTINITCPNPASGVVNIHISSDDDIEFVSPIVFVDGKFIGVKWSMPCDITWDTTKLPNGSYNLRVKAYYRLMRKWLSSDRVIEVLN